MPPNLNPVIPPCLVLESTGVYRCLEMGFLVRSSASRISCHCGAHPAALTEPAHMPAAPEDQSARCRACPSYRVETPMSGSCLRLDATEPCQRNRILRHQARLLDPAFRCDGPPLPG